MATPKTIEVSRRSRRAVLLRDVRWSTYCRLTRELEGQNVRMTYDRGVLEIMSPSDIHEQIKMRLAAIVGIIAEELDIDFLYGGSPTIKRRKLLKGVEPDQCFWIATAAIVAAKNRINSSKNPPDLAIEVDITSSSINRMKIYAAIRIPEVWRYDGSSLLAYQLDAENTYQQVSQSIAFPAVPLAVVEANLERGDGVTDLQWTKTFRRLVRDYRDKQ